MEHKTGSFPRVFLLATMVWLATCVVESQASKKCPPGSVFYARDHTCFSLHDNAKTWADARSFCRKQGGYLISLYEPMINEFFIKFVLKTKDKKNRYWIGLQNHFEEGKESYRWLDEGYSTLFTHWPKGNVQPDNCDKSKYCTYVHGSKSYWDVMECDKTLPFACETSILDQDTMFCESDWELYRKEGRCYKVAHEYRTWQQARDICRKKGGDLATVYTSEINKFLVRILPPKGSFWIGLNDQQKEGQFRWLDEEFLSDYFNWIDGEPNDSIFNGGEDCTAIISPHRGRWNDFPCDARTKYICERSANIVVHDSSKD